MARTWAEAQQRERAFWKRVYVDREQDIKSYTPIDREIAIAFLHKTLKRFGTELTALDGKTVADIGCGPYGLIYGIVESRDRFARAPHLIGVDPLMEFYTSQIGLLRASDQVELHAAQAETLPIADASCDFTFCVNALDHVDRPADVVAELDRITKPDGLCAVSLHTVTRPFAPVHSLLKYVDTNHPHHFTVERVRSLLAARFARVDVSHVAKLTDDQPEFGFRSLLTSRNKPVAAMRWVSTFVLQSVYFSCRKRA